MYNNKKVTIIVTAAGKGKRMGSSLPKQFLNIGGITVLEKAVRPFEELKETDDIIIVAPAEHIKRCESLCRSFEKIKNIIPGGNERQDSVNNALKLVKDGLVLIHDGARPYVTPDIIKEVLSKADTYGAAAAAVAVKDTVRQLSDIDTFGSITLDRSKLFNVQTPQGFDARIIKQAFKKAYEDGYYGTDDAVLAERAGNKVVLVKGSYGNIKVTTKEDLPLEMRVGSGFDVHRLVKDRKLILCGVEIPFEKGLLGHSDADVAVHALMDAILGAAALGDIGKYFPDNDMKYKDASSIELLRSVADMIKTCGYKVSNADITIMAQRPKISPFIAKMGENISKTLGLEENCINVKATTTEKLGFVGREEGIAAEAVCILIRS